jgi:hypothetical protein
VKEHNHENRFNRRELLPCLAPGAGVSAALPGLGQAAARHSAPCHEEGAAALALDSAEPRRPRKQLTVEGRGFRVQVSRLGLLFDIRHLTTDCLQ